MDRFSCARFRRFGFRCLVSRFRDPKSGNPYFCTGIGTPNWDLHSEPPDKEKTRDPFYGLLFT